MNRKYERERRMMNAIAKKDFMREDALKKIYEYQIKRLQQRIDSAYMRYGHYFGENPEVMRQAASQFDVTRFYEAARLAVEKRDFSPETNRWLKIYNMKMNVSRDELLKKEIEHELILLYHEEENYIKSQIYDEAIKELERQSGIHGNSAMKRSKVAERIVEADFYGNSFSERIWGRNGRFEHMRQEVFTSLANMYTDMDGYARERRRLMQSMNVSENEAMRLLKTEMSRANSQAQQLVLEENGFTHYRYVAEPGACDLCDSLDGTVHRVSESQIGINTHPMHPNCRCSRYGIIEMEHKINGSNISQYEVYDSAEEWLNRTSKT